MLYFETRPMAPLRCAVRAYYFRVLMAKLTVFAATNAFQH